VLIAKRLILLVLAAAVATPVAAQRNVRPVRPNVTLPEGPVRNVILKSCTACHGIDEYAYYAMARDDWLALIERMKVTPSGLITGAVIGDEDREILLDWLVAEFGPESTPFPREYIPAPVSESDILSDAQAQAQLADACASCHTLDRVHESRLAVAQWRATLVRELGRGAPLLIDDVEPLVDWLARKRGVNPEN